MDRPVTNGFCKTLTQNVPMFPFHHKDFVSPTKHASRDGYARRALGAGGFNSVAWNILKDFFGRSAAPLVATANEKQFYALISQAKTKVEISRRIIDGISHARENTDRTSCAHQKAGHTGCNQGMQ